MFSACYSFSRRVITCFALFCISTQGVKIESKRIVDSQLYSHLLHCIFRRSCIWKLCFYWSALASIVIRNITAIRFGVKLIIFILCGVTKVTICRLFFIIISRSIFSKNIIFIFIASLILTSILFQSFFFGNKRIRIILLSFIEFFYYFGNS